LDEPWVPSVFRIARPFVERSLKCTSSFAQEVAGHVALSSVVCTAQPFVERSVKKKNFAQEVAGCAI
jgi:hypothetical protein